MGERILVYSKYYSVAFSTTVLNCFYDFFSRPIEVSTVDIFFGGFCLQSHTRKTAYFFWFLFVSFFLFFGFSFFLF